MRSGMVLPDGAEILLATAMSADRTGQVFDDDPIQPDEALASDGYATSRDTDPVIQAGVRWLRSQVTARA